MIRWKFLHTILIQLKVTERQLGDVWLEHQSRHWQLRVNDHAELEKWKMRVFKLRYRMTFFVQNLLAFFTGEIIDPNWTQLERKMERAVTVDEFLKDHTDFLNDCRKECMLTDVRFVEVSRWGAWRGVACGQGLMTSNPPFGPLLAVPRSTHERSTNTLRNPLKTRRPRTHGRIQLVGS